MKRRYMVVLSVLFLMFTVSEAFAGMGCGGDCNQCHQLDKKDAERILKDVVCGTVTEVKRSPIGGLWQVDVDVKGEPGIFYVDFEKNMLS